MANWRNNLKNEMFITIDSGGSKTKLSLYDSDNVLIKNGSAGGFALAIDSDFVHPELVSVLKGFCACDRISVAVCNLGGRNKRQIEATLKHVFPNAIVNVFREAEGNVGIALCNKYDAQATLMAGTGSIVIAPAGENVVIYGGWGANVSDAGSGYQLGLDAIRLALSELDGLDPLSELTKRLTGKSAPSAPMKQSEFCKYRDSARDAMAPYDRAHIASYAKTVYECARAGDIKAQALYDKTGKDLAQNVLSAVKKSGQGLKNLVVTGGMVRAREFWMESFEKTLKDEHSLENVYYIADGISDAMEEMIKNTKGEK